MSYHLKKGCTFFKLIYTLFFSEVHCQYINSETAFKFNNIINGLTVFSNWKTKKKILNYANKFFIDLLILKIKIQLNCYFQNSCFVSDGNCANFSLFRPQNIQYTFYHTNRKWERYILCNWSFGFFIDQKLKQLVSFFVFLFVNTADKLKISEKSFYKDI